MVLPPESEEGKRREWEVYARLISGNSFVLADKLTRKGSGKTLGAIVGNMMEQTNSVFVTTSEAAIVFEHVARVYVDTQENEFVTMLEDSSGESYELDRGSQAKCRASVELVASTILQHMNQKETP